MSKILLILFMHLSSFYYRKEPWYSYDAVYSGVQWFDDRGMEVNAHGACIVEEDGKYYLFGEYHTDTSNAFVAFSCYSSTDLYNWKFENLVLKTRENGLLGSKRVGERVKVMRCPKTGEYVMYMHTDDLGYRDPHIGYATSSEITGNYVFHGALLFNGMPVKKWDMGTYQDTDGIGYLLIHGGNIFKLSDDYKSITEKVTEKIFPEGESPVVFKANGTYFWISSFRTSWERNDNFYCTAASLKGPWTIRGTIAPKGTLTWNSQSTFVLPVCGSKDTTYIYMGDRWSYPRQQTAATYVWQPLVVSENTIQIPVFSECWQINTKTGEWKPENLTGKTYDNDYSGKRDVHLVYTGEWSHIDNTDTESISGVPGSSLSIKFSGNRIALYGTSNNRGGYARIILEDIKTKKIIFTTITDFYSKYTISGLKLISPLLNKSDYILELSVMGEHGVWYSKNGTFYGSTGNDISIDKIMVENSF